MFFILSKILDIFLVPYTWIFVLALCSVLLKDKKKKTISGILLIVLLFISANTPFVNYLFQQWEPAPQSIEQLHDSSTAIILTGVTQLDKKPFDRVYFQKGADRITQAIMLYRKGKIKNFLITGGSGKLMGGGRAEATELKKILMDCSIPESIIYTETVAVNTRENAVYTKALLDQTKTLGPNFILITSAFHMRRSMGCFNKVGIPYTPFPVDYYSFDEIDNPVDYVIPKAKPLSNLSVLIREITGYYIYRVMGYL